MLFAFYIKIVRLLQFAIFKNDSNQNHSPVKTSFDLNYLRQTWVRKIDKTLSNLHTVKTNSGAYTHNFQSTGLKGQLGTCKVKQSQDIIVIKN